MRGSSVRDLAVCALLTVVAASASIMGDECDWTARSVYPRSLSYLNEDDGLTTSSVTKGVTPVYLRCSSGKVRWQYPRGALRVLLRLPGQDRNFRGCLKMRKNGNKELAARVFLEGPRSLLPLYTTKEGASKSIRCFHSKNGQAAIYIEATDDRSFEKQVIELDYDLQQLSRSARAYDPTEECRPCTSEELSYTFCTSDLVTRGTIHDVTLNEDLDLSEVTIKVTELIRQTGLSSGDISNDVVEEMERLVTVGVPQRCGVAPGAGEFIFMARRKLGDLALQCAPRLEDWMRLVKQLEEQGGGNCLLKS